MTILAAAAGGVQRAGFERMVAEVCLGKVGAVCAREVSRFARNSRDWQQLIEMCRVVDTVLIDQEAVYAPRHGNDRLLLGLKGSLNEYELDLLRQRSLAARYEKARRGELVVSAPVREVRQGRRPLREEARTAACPGGDRAWSSTRCWNLAARGRRCCWFHRAISICRRSRATGPQPGGVPNYATVHRMIENPIYGGAYAYGKTAARGGV